MAPETTAYVTLRSKSYPSRPRLFTLPSLYEGRSVGDARLLVGHDFFNYLNEAEIAGCEGAINDGRELAAYQPLNYCLTRSEKSDITSPLSYTQVAENFREKFAPTEWWVGLDSCEGSSRGDKSAVSSSSRARIDAPLNRRAPARAAIASYNALHKVYRTRLDEKRSHTRLEDFANSSAMPQLMLPRLPYEGFLSKNTDHFTSTQLFQTDLLKS
jgi:hypothetical protein